MVWLAKRNPAGFLSDIANREPVVWGDGSVDINVSGPPPNLLAYSPVKLDANGQYIQALTVDDELNKMVFGPKLMAAIVRCLASLPSNILGNFPIEARALITNANQRIRTVINNRTPSVNE